MDKDTEWCISHDKVWEPGVVAHYGMVNVFREDRECRPGWLDTIHKVSHYGDTEELWVELKEFLNKDLLKTSREMLKHCWDLDLSMDEPICVVDLGKYKFWAQRRYSTLLCTWTMLDAPLDLKAACELYRMVGVADWMKSAKRSS
jgi:hypothetical protein